MGFHIISVDFLVERTGLDDPVVRILSGILVAYPLAILYGILLYKKHPMIQHVFLTVCGLFLAVFLYGLDGLHTLVAVVVQYLFIHTIGPNSLMIIMSFIFQMTYLIVGYLKYSTDSYDIAWTTAQCIIVLRLLGVAWDTYDGAHDLEKASSDTKALALTTPPSFLEMTGHAYFFGSFVVGPQVSEILRRTVDGVTDVSTASGQVRSNCQFPMRRYLSFVCGTLVPPEDDHNSVKIKKGLLRFASGLTYLIVYVTFDAKIDNEFLVSKEFEIDDTPLVTPRSKNPPVDLVRCKWDKFFPAEKQTTKKDWEGLVASLKSDMSTISSTLLERIHYNHRKPFEMLIVLLTVQIGVFLHLETYSLVKKLGYITLWGRIALCKYLGVWLVAEGSCIMSGLTYNGKSELGEPRWDALKNCKLTIYETSTTLQGVIDSFNVNTNMWMSRYVFKRLRFLGNKTLSHMVTLLFLAVWHGIYIGYFVCFISEYAYITGERQVLFVSKLVREKLGLPNSGIWMAIRLTFAFFMKSVLMSYCLLPFCLLTFSRIYKVYSTTYAFPHVLLLTWLLLYAIISPSFIKKDVGKRDESKKAN